MTRETKIGLLVGLAFIIVIGILLSDHLTSSNDPPPAVLGLSGNSVRDTIRTPGGSQPPITPVVVATQVTPQQPVRTQADLDAQQKALAIIKVGAPPAASTTPPANPAVTRTNTPEPYPPVQPALQQQTVAQNSSIGTGHPLEQIAAQHGEPLVTSTPSGNDRTTQPGARAEASGTGEYTAQAGDTLSRIAGRLMGANTKANRDAIVRANPSLQANPDKVIVGKVYKIPGAPTVAAASATPTQTPAAAPAAAVVAAQNAGEYWYTVKEGDTLTRIAREQLGQGDSAIPSLVELNREIIKDPNSLLVNMRIRLPGKPVAQIN